MAKTRLRNVSPLGDIWVLGQVVKAGEVFEVDSAQAGHAPSAFRLVDNDADDRPADHLTRPVIDDESGLQKTDEQGRPLVEAYDPGAGLLAQTGNFEKVTASAKDHPQPQATEKA